MQTNLAALAFAVVSHTSLLVLGYLACTKRERRGAVSCQLWIGGWGCGSSLALFFAVLEPLSYELSGFIRAHPIPRHRFPDFWFGDCRHAWNAGLDAAYLVLEAAIDRWRFVDGCCCTRQRRRGRFLLWGSSAFLLATQTRAGVMMWIKRYRWNIWFGIALAGRC